MLSRTTTTGLILSAFVLAGFAGVSTGDLLGDGETGMASAAEPAPVQAFEARYHIQGENEHELEYRLSFEPEVHDRHGDLWEAYRLAVYHEGSHVWSEYLDTDLLPYVMSGRPGDDANQWIRFAEYGYSTALGLDVPGQMEEKGFLRYQIGTKIVEYEPIVEVTSEGTWYRTDPHMLPPNRGHHLGIANHYFFEPGLPFPSIVLFRLKDDSFQTRTLMEYTLLEQLPVPVSPPRDFQPVPTNPRKDTWLFPGEYDDIWEWGLGEEYTARPLVEAFIAWEAENHEGKLEELLADGHCIVRFSFVRDPGGPSSLLEDPVGNVFWWLGDRRLGLFEFFVYDDRPGGGSAYLAGARVAASLDGPEFTSWSINDWGNYSLYDSSPVCHLKEDYLAQVHPVDAMEEARRIMPDHYSQWGFEWGWGSAFSPTSEVTNGWNEYVHYFSGAGIAMVVQNADRDTLVRVSLEAEFMPFKPSID